MGNKVVVVDGAYSDLLPGVAYVLVHPARFTLASAG